MASVSLAVTGMHCGHCQIKVEKALKGVEGVQAAVVDLQGGRAEVEFDEGKATIESLVGAVRDAGYTARAGQ